MEKGSRGDSVSAESTKNPEQFVTVQLSKVSKFALQISNLT